jgi:hypothetical protein
MVQSLVWRFVGLVGVGMLLALPAWGTPANKAALERHFDRFLIKKLQSCDTCHQHTEVKDPDSLEEIPHNPFGAALRKAGKELRAAGRKREMSVRLEMVGGLDSDGDGVDNLSELLLGHNPGDANDRPTAGEMAELGAKREAYGVFLKSYRWEPFEVVKRPAVPGVAAVGKNEHGRSRMEDGGRNPIDAFVEEQRRAHGVGHSAEAPKGVLLRRVYLDLIGLNPTPGEMEAFEKDGSPDAYEKVVDRLLADPRYGQRWGRHWMDVWRYSDWAGWTDGKQIRDSQPHIWRWRDWIVESLNADKGYDRMVLEMLAADELCPEDESALRATGFLARNFKLLSREQWLEDTVNHTSRAFLGLTMQCAKCHDHKFDPVTQEEYYEMRAIFEPHNVRIDPVPGELDKTKDGLARVYDKYLAQPTRLYLRGDERTPDTKRGPVAPGVPAALGGELSIKAVQLPGVAAHPDRRAFVRKELIAQAEAALEGAKKALEAASKDAKTPGGRKRVLELGLAIAKAKRAEVVAMCRAEGLEDGGKKGSAEWASAATQTLAAQRQVAVATATRDLLVAREAEGAARGVMEGAKDAAAREKGAKDLKGAQGKNDAAEKALAKAAIELAEGPGTAYKPRSTDDYPQTSTGRRLALARWIVDPRNPLAARVAVNHLWARHFAQGLVPSVDDFGGNGRAATHPALLDWLASELMSNGWHMKPIHRLIVTSATYRQASTANEKDLASDPDDVYLWRMPSKRMEAEIVRDNVLWAAGDLDVTLGGPEIDQALGLTNHRRSLYFRSAPEKEVEFLKLFDGPNVTECYMRRPSVVPQQALALGNSQLVVEQARVLAGKLGSLDDEAFVRGAFLRVLARAASDEEVKACEAFLADPSHPAGRGREDLITVLFNHNDFVTIR